MQFLAGYLADGGSEPQLQEPGKAMSERDMSCSWASVDADARKVHREAQRRMLPPASTCVPGEGCGDHRGVHSTLRHPVAHRTGRLFDGGLRPRRGGGRDGVTMLTSFPGNPAWYTLRKSIYSLRMLREPVGTATCRYPDSFAAEYAEPGLREMEKIAPPIGEAEARCQGSDLFHVADVSAYHAILRAGSPSASFMPATRAATSRVSRGRHGRGGASGSRPTASSRRSTSGILAASLPFGERQPPLHTQFASLSPFQLSLSRCPSWPLRLDRFT